MNRTIDWMLVGACAFILCGCAGQRQQSPDQAAPSAPSGAGNRAPGVPHNVRAMVKLAPTTGNRVEGTVYFVEEPQGTRVSGEIVGLLPGDHGFHIHETGDCSAPDASSAGGHFNPTGAPHGGPRTSARHLGDLGNITAGQDGRAHLSEVIIPGLPFSGPNSVLGRALVVHAGSDDLTSQPAGNSGPRVACGVIRASR